MEGEDPRANYPLVLAPLAVEKVWGGDALARMFPSTAPAATNVGEVWLVWEGLPVTNGPLAGRTLKDVFAASPEDIVGTSVGDVVPSFPLLVKFLDARENLSVQVHPDDTYARSRESQPFGKCEMWYVLGASEGAFIFHGLNRDLSETEVQDALAGPSVVDLLERIEVHPGDVVVNTPGIIHALGAGVVIFELQQSSDLTYRLYDWDRGTEGGVRRELHLEQGAEVTDRRAIVRHKIDPMTLDEGAFRRRLLAACRYFAAELLDLPDGASLPLDGGQLHILTVLDGFLQVRSIEPGSPSWDLGPGQSCLIPAAAGSTEIVVNGRDCRLIRSFIPDLRRDVVDPLRAKGVEDERIAQLGGDGDRSDLWLVLARL